MRGGRGATTAAPERAPATTRAEAPTTAPMREGTSRVTNTTTHHRAYQFHINGVTDPAAVARQVQRLLTEQERQDRDQTTRGEA